MRIVTPRPSFRSFAARRSPGDAPAPTVASRRSACSALSSAAARQAPMASRRTRSRTDGATTSERSAGEPSITTGHATDRSPVRSRNWRIPSLHAPDSGEQQRGAAGQDRQRDAARAEGDAHAEERGQRADLELTERRQPDGDDPRAAGATAQLARHAQLQKALGEEV